MHINHIIFEFNTYIILIQYFILKLIISSRQIWNKEKCFVITKDELTHKNLRITYDFHKLSGINYININKSKKIIFYISKFLIELFTMPNDKYNVEDLIREYLLEEGILKDKIDSDKFDFGFIITFPLGSKSQNLSVYKPKNMNGIFITVRFQISQEKAEIINSFKINKRNQLFSDLRKYLLIREVFFTFNFQNLIIEIHEQIYPNKEGFISKNSLFKLIQKVFYCYLFSNLLIEEYCTGKIRLPSKFGLFF